MKHAFILDPSHGTNIAWMSSASMHEMDATYGRKAYDVNEKNVYSQLMFETNFTPEHNLAVGASLNHDYVGQTYLGQRLNEKENVVGGYAQYTYNLHERLVAMAGIRVDHSSEYGTFVTPRFHVKWQVNDLWSLRASAGKGYRTVHALAENNYLMASGRQLVIDKLDQESAWNYGLSTALNIPLGRQTLKVNAEYYYTRFGNQVVIDYDTDPTQIHIGNLHGKSYSHTFQIDATYDLFRGMTMTAAYRYNDVKTTYGGELLRQPLTNRYKGLLTVAACPRHTPWPTARLLGKKATPPMDNSTRRSPAPSAISQSMWVVRTSRAISRKIRSSMPRILGAAPSIPPLSGVPCRAQEHISAYAII